jgi:hypothetical protein
MATDPLASQSIVDRLPCTTVVFSAAYVSALQREEALEDPLAAAKGIAFGVSSMTALIAGICWVAFG